MTARNTDQLGALDERLPEPERVSLTRADFETVLAALEDDAEVRAREDAQDVLQSRAPRPWLQDLEDAENARREIGR